MAEVKEVKKEAKSVTRAEFDDLAAKVRRMSDNWKKFADVHIGSGAKDGKMGKASIWVCAGITIIGLMSIAFAEDVVVWYNGDATWGTAKITSDLAGTATLTVDAMSVSTLTTTTDGVTDGGWFITNTAAASELKVIGGETNTATITMEADDGDDAADTSTIVVGTDGDMTVTVGGADLIVAATIDCTAITVDATKGIDVKSTGKLIVGTATADAIDIGKTTEITTIKGLLNVDEVASFDVSPTVLTRYPILAKDGTTQPVMEYGLCTNGQVVAYTTVFGAVPQIFLTYQEDSGADVVAEASSINETNFTVIATTEKSLAWMAVGTK